MRLLLFFTNNVSLNDWAESGIFDREVQLYQKMTQKGIEVTFLTYGDKKDKEFENILNGIKIKPLYENFYRPKNTIIRSILNLLLPYFFRKTIKKADLLKTNQVWGGFVAVLAKKMFKKPLLVRSGWEPTLERKNFDINIFRSFFIKLNSYFVYKNADQIIVTSNRIVEHIENKFKISKSVINKKENYIDINSFVPKTKTTKFFNNRVLAVSRLTKQKNLEILIDALSNTQYALDVVGDGELKESLKKRAKNLNVEVNFMGIIPNNKLAGLYPRYPVYVICSKVEGNPKSLLEAMSCACGVVGTNVLGINDVISSKNNGLICDSNSKSLKDAIEFLMKNKETREKFGNLAREKIINENSLENYLDTEINLYRKMVAIN